MDYQKTIDKPTGANRTNGSEQPTAELGKNVADFTHDVASLVEMQTELFTIDLKEAADISLLPLCIGLAGCLLLLAGFPVALIGVAWLMVSAWSISPAVAFFATGFAAVLVACGIVWIVWLRLREGVATFGRSISALKTNFQWVKRRLNSKGRR
jgi:uncharacterized membrane protein YqjE